MNFKVLLTVSLLSLALLKVEAAGDSATIADFDSNSPTNNLGGASGSFSGEKPDNNCKITKSPVEKHGAEGASLQVDFNVGEEGCYNGFWMRVAPEEASFDASKFKKLTFWIKGSATTGIPSEIKCEIKSGPDKSGVVYVTGITSEWQKKELLLKDFAGSVDLSRLIEIFMVFEQRKAMPASQGILFFDDFRFE